MCGILGINKPNQTAIQEAAQTIAHRGPDMYGEWIDEQVSLGFDRLSIIDLDKRASQPMWDDAHEISVIFNGEIYNFRELKKELEKEFRFQTTSDTEVLLYGYKKYGPQFAERLHGMFAFAVYDTRSQSLILFRDHAGIKPLLYYFDGSVFCFASEMKALLELLGSQNIKLKLDREALNIYFALGYIPSPQTLYTHIKKVPRGSYIEFDLADKRISGATPIPLPKVGVRNESELFELIERVIVEQVVADVPVGVFFSGGTDSSLIASVLHKKGIDLETFSVALPERDKDKRYFSEIAAHLKLRRNEFDFGSREFDATYEPVMSRLDEPLAETSLFPTYFIAQKARERVKVVLSGEGGDELFFGYYQQAALARLRGRVDQNMTLLDHTYLASPDFKGKNALFQKLFAAAAQPISLYLSVSAPARDATSKDAWATGKRAVAYVRDPLYFDRDIYLENDLLRKTDLTTSFNSIEGRVPLLDPRIVAAAPVFESAFTSGKIWKPILKRMLEHNLPKHLVNRPKSGFGLPLKTSFETSLALKRDLAEAISFLASRNLLLMHLPRSRATLIERFPNACFALVSLYRTILNNERSLKA